MLEALIASLHSTADSAPLALAASSPATDPRVLAYYRAVAPLMRPHIVRRPLWLCDPCGSAGARRIALRPSGLRPRDSQVGEARVPALDGARLLFLHSDKGVVELARRGAVEFFASAATLDVPDRPDRLTFLLEPGPGTTWRRQVRAAFLIRDRLGDLGLRSFARTGRGSRLAMVVPLDTTASWNEVRRFANAFSAMLVRLHPADFVTRRPTRSGVDRILLSWQRSAPGGATTVPYSLYAEPELPAATPLSWSELARMAIPPHYNAHNLRARLRRLEADPWEGFEAVQQNVPIPIGDPTARTAPSFRTRSPRLPPPGRATTTGIDAPRAM